MNIYMIQLRGQVEIDELNLMSNHQMTLVKMRPAATFMTINTDQSGMLGLARHLHSLGFEILSIVLQSRNAAAG